MDKCRLPLFVSSTIFFIVAMLHLLRLMYKVEVVAGGVVIPMSLSVFGLIAALLLALWIFRCLKT